MSNIHAMLAELNKPNKCADCQKQTDRLSVAEEKYWNGHTAEWAYQHKHLCPDCLYDHNEKQKHIVYAL